MVRNFPPASMYTKNRLQFRARIPGGWAAAATTTAQKRLSDVLNLESGQVAPIIVEDLILTADGGDERRAEFGCLNLALAQLVIPVEESEDARSNSFEWVRKRPNLVRAGFEEFEVVGDMHLAEGQNLRDVLVRPIPAFLPIAAAQLIHRATGHLEQHRVVFANRKLATFIVPEG